MCISHTTHQSDIVTHKTLHTQLHTDTDTQISISLADQTKQLSVIVQVDSVHLQ